MAQFQPDNYYKVVLQQNQSSLLPQLVVVSSFCVPSADRASTVGKTHFHTSVATVERFQKTKKPL